MHIPGAIDLMGVVGTIVYTFLHKGILVGIHINTYWVVIYKAKLSYTLGRSKENAIFIHDTRTWTFLLHIANF